MGIARLTQDIDVTLVTGFRNEKKYAKLLLSRFQSRVPDAYVVFMCNSPNKIPDLLSNIRICVCKLSADL